MPTLRRHGCSPRQGVWHPHAGVEALLADPDIDLVLNLTIPAAHFDISLSALSAGKHVFTEKPLATSAADGRRLVAEAAKRGLLLGSAPDTFLGAAGRRARRLMDEGAIGRPVTGTAFMMGRGMEHWHPNPQFYYQPGGGPVFDMGPYYLTMLVNLLGPVGAGHGDGDARSGRAHDHRRRSLQGHHFKVGTPTNILSLLEFRSGATVTFGASWDVFTPLQPSDRIAWHRRLAEAARSRHLRRHRLASARGADWADFASEAELYGARNWPYAAPDRANYRMLGVADLARALTSGRKPRASGDLALHVLEIMEAILASGDGGGPVEIEDEPPRPTPLPEEEAAAFLAGKGRRAVTIVAIAGR